MLTDAPVFIVGTRFQAMMARGIVASRMPPTFDVIVLSKFRSQSECNDVAINALSQSARHVVWIDRSAPKYIQCAELARAVGARVRDVGFASVAHSFVVATLFSLPGARIFTFDEGGYNIDPSGPFFHSKKRRRDGGMELLFRLLLPGGPLAWCKSLRGPHFTAFDPSRNLFANRAVMVSINWAECLQKNEAVLASKCKTLLALPCFADLSVDEAVIEKMREVASRCDVVVRHPRDTAVPVEGAVPLESPIEAVVDAARQNQTVRVFHWKSTVGLTLANWSSVELTDLSRELDEVAAAGDRRPK